MNTPDFSAEPAAGEYSVIVCRDQVASVLPLLASALSLRSVLFQGHNLAGSPNLVAAVGIQRVLTGMVASMPPR